MQCVMSIASVVLTLSISAFLSFPLLGSAQSLQPQVATPKVLRCVGLSGSRVSSYTLTIDRNPLVNPASAPGMMALVLKNTAAGPRAYWSGQVLGFSAPGQTLFVGKGFRLSVDIQAQAMPGFGFPARLMAEAAEGRLDERLGCQFAR